MMLLTLFLVILLFGSIYVIYNLYKKYDALETIAQENVDFIVSIRTRVLSQRSYLKQLDRKGAFESDDEVGYFFKELKQIVSDISSYLEMEPEQEEETRPNSGGKIERF